MNTFEPGSEEKQFTYLNITFSNKGAAELSGKRCVVFIPRDEIRRIESKMGSRAERPLLQGIAGVILCGMGLVGLRLFINAGAAFLRWEAGFVFFGGLGGWLLWEVLEKRHYLLVRCSEGNRKLVFHGQVKQAELDEFLKNATRLGYNCG